MDQFPQHSESPPLVKTYALSALAALGLLAAYVLSVGPAMRYMAMAPTRAVAKQRMRTMDVIYAPLIWLESKSRSFQKALEWYVPRWVPPVPRPPPKPPLPEPSN